MDVEGVETRIAGLVVHSAGIHVVVLVTVTVLSAIVAASCQQHAQHIGRQRTCDDGSQCRGDDPRNMHLVVVLKESAVR